MLAVVFGPTINPFTAPNNVMTEPPNTESPPAEKSLSKNALKRQLKRERWEESRQERRAAKRAKIKQKREELKHSGETLPKKRKTSVKNQEESEIRVVLDCSFDELMNEKVQASPPIAKAH